MKRFIASLALMATSTLAAPIVKKADIDLTVLQFALTLEHLENYFYTDALNKWPESEFLAAGYSAQYYSNLKYIAHDEQSHVQYLTAGITAAGGTPVAACTYSFPYTDINSFVTLSSVIEGVGTSAYLGAAGLITDKNYLTAAGAILVTEALHTSMQRGAIGRVPQANPYGTPLNPSPVYTLAAGFITSCPSTNMAFPFTAFPALTDVQGTPASPGMSFEFSVASIPSGDFYATYINGLTTVSVKPTSVVGNHFFVTAPTMIGGQTYVLLTNTNVTGMPITDSDVIAGPAIIEYTPDSPTFGIGK